MCEPGVGLRLEIEIEPDAEAAEIEEAASQLRHELLELDVEAVGVPAGEPAPPGSRGIDAGALGTLLVAAGRGAIGPIVQTVQSWVARRATRSVKLTIENDSLELTNVSPEDQRRLIESFLARHTPDGP
jgi:Effector Associated Constant Component 1